LTSHFRVPHPFALEKGARGNFAFTVFIQGG
jgi:hypothetical protein